MNKIVSAVCGLLYTSLKCADMVVKYEISGKSILHFLRYVRIISLTLIVF